MPFHGDALALLAPFSRPFPKIDFGMHFGRPLVALWLTFGSLLDPFGSLLVPIADLLAPLWYHLAHNGSQKAPQIDTKSEEKSKRCSPIQLIRSGCSFGVIFGVI